MWIRKSNRVQNIELSRISDDLCKSFTRLTDGSSRPTSPELKPEGRVSKFPVVIGAGPHPFPFRTRKLSLLPSMVLCGKLHGRVDRCREYSVKAAVRNHSGFFCIY